jgi:hypothetical protein
MHEQLTNPFCRDLAGARSLLDEGSNSGNAGQGGNSSGMRCCMDVTMHALWFPLLPMRRWQHQQQLPCTTLLAPQEPAWAVSKGAN